jgi:two-component system NarL family response regulator
MTTVEWGDTMPERPESPAAPVRVLIADDHPVFRDGLVILLGQQEGIEVIGAAGSGAEVLERCRDALVDVVLVDLRMKPMDGIEVVAALAEAEPEVRVLVLSAFDADDDVYRAMRAGAAGYLLKNSSPAELADAIRRAHQGDTCIPAPLAARLASHVSRPHLTARQEEVLKLIAQGLSNQEIADNLRIVEGTVKAHVKSILAKLGARDRTQAISIALTRGLVRVP